jgi:hypothetical protein
MARGWGKSAEDQIADREAQEASAQASAKKQSSAESATRQRQRQALELQRDRVLDERTSSPHRRAALEAALSEIESKLKAL